MDVMMASCFLDAKKPKHIPLNFYRQMSVYVSPEMTYYFLKEYDNNVDLYIIDISKYDWRIASEGISGFCLAYWDDNKFEYPSEWRKYRKLYWDNCFSKEEYLSQSEKVKKSDDVYGLDEILIQNFISPDDIIQIGTFKDKHFYYQDVIKKFALNNFYKDFEKAE